MKIDPMIIYLILLALMVITALLAVIARTLLKASIALAITSAILTIIMFKLNSPLAAVFELSVCAGLITVLFVSVISLTNRMTHAEIMELTKTRLQRYWYLIVIVAAGILFAMYDMPAHIDAPKILSESENNVKFIFWNMRMTDLLAQIIIILVGVFGVVVLLKEVLRKNDE